MIKVILVAILLLIGFISYISITLWIGCTIMRIEAGATAKPRKFFYDYYFQECFIYGFSLQFGIALLLLISNAIVN